MPEVRVQNILTDLAARLAAAPEAAAELTARRKAVSDELHRALDRMKEIEARVSGEVAAEADESGNRRFPNEAARAGEIARRLAADPEYQQCRAAADRLREELRGLDAEIERVQRRHQSDAALASVAAALFQAGRADLAEAALAAYGGDGRPQAGAGAQPREERGDGLQEAEVVVLAARMNDNGVVRAWCEAADGSRVAVFARDAAGSVLLNSRGRRVRARCRRVDRGLYAVEASLVG